MDKRELGSDDNSQIDSTQRSDTQQQTGDDSTDPHQTDAVEHVFDLEAMTGETGDSSGPDRNYYQANSGLSHHPRSTRQILRLRRRR